MENKNTFVGPPGGFWLRAGAQFIDAAILTGCFIFVSILFAVALPQLTHGDGKERMKEVGMVMVTVVYFLIPGLYFTITTALWGGTVGKRVFNLRVVRMDGQTLSYPLSLWRWICYYISALPLGLGYILAGLFPQKRALHDFMANTKVVLIGPANQSLVIVLLVAVPVASVPVLGIIAAIAIPKFAQMLEKSREGATKMNLKELQSAVAGYRREHGGKKPTSLEKDLVPKHIAAIPEVKATGAFIAKAKSPKGNKVTMTAGRAPNTSGEGWLYNSSNGRVYVNSTVKDSKGIPYSFYGSE